MTATATLTADQLDYIVELQDEDDTYADLPPVKVAALLRKQNHPLFPADEPEKPKAKKKPKRTVKKKKPKPAPEPEVVEDEAPPTLEADPPAALVEADETQSWNERKERAKAELVKDDPAPAPLATVPEHEIEGMEGVDNRDLVIPRLQIKQAQTRDDDNVGIADITNGDLFLSNDPEGACDEREIVFLQITPGRSFMLDYKAEVREDQLEKLGLDDVPEQTNVVCFSLDRETPVEVEDRAWSALSDSCETCPHAKWKRKKGGKSRPPACGEVYRCLILDITDGGATPARFHLRSSAIKPAKSLLTNLKLATRRHKRPISGFTVAISTKEVNGKEGNYFVPRFSRPELIESVDEAAAYRQIREELLGAIGSTDGADGEA